jgi:hypothetical protein
MRKAIPAAVATALLAGGVTSLAGTPSKDETSRCTRSGAETLLANPDARVYAVFKGHAQHANAFRTAIYACRYKTGRTFKLGTAWQTSDENVGNDMIRYIRSVTLSRGVVAPAVAFVDTNCLGHPCRIHVVVRSLGDGHVIRRLKAGGSFDQLNLSVHNHGQGGVALAWLETSAGGTCDSGCRVHLVRHSSDRVLDAGTDIDASVFGRVDNERPGIVASGNANEFVWKRGNTVKVASFND